MKIEKVIILGEIPKNMLDSDVTIDHSIMLGDISLLESGVRILRDKHGDIIVEYDKSLEIGKFIIEDSFWI